MEDRNPTQDERLAFRKAQEFILPFGKYRGSAVDKIAETDAGLKWLDWALTIEKLHPTTRLHIETYLAWPSIARELSDVSAK